MFLLTLLFALGSAIPSFAQEKRPSLSYKWIPQFYGKLNGADKLLYTRSFARSQLRFVDIDHDGDADIFVGKADGRLAFFLNQGTKTTPLFKLITENFEVIHEGVDEQSNPILVRTVLDVGNNAAPDFVDIDNDGDFDLFIGSKDGHVFHYENRGNRLSPRFFRKTPIYMGLKFDGNSVPRFADVNGDRAIDMFVGTRSGKVYLYFNSGMADEAVFCDNFKIADPPDIRCKYQPELVVDIAPQVDAVPEMVDWDQDQDLEMIVGKSNGKINYYHNIGDRFSPKWEIKSRHFQFIDTGGSVAPSFFDINGDNFPELFLGTSSSMVSYYKNHEILIDLLRKISALQLEQLDLTASFENILSQACSQLKGLPECLTTFAVAFNVPAGTKTKKMEELYPFILRPDLSLDLNIETTEDSADDLPENTALQNNNMTADALQGQKEDTLENIDAEADRQTTETTPDSPQKIKKEKKEKPQSHGLITRNQLWLTSRNFFNIENLIGSEKNSFVTSGDWNKDGRIDILLGSRSGEIFAFENRAQQGFDWYQLKFPALKKNKRKHSSPVLTDLDGDGDLDIITGNRRGKIEWILNRGTEKSPDWIVHDVNISQIDVGSFSAPALQDMDGDDDIDLLVGNSAGFIIYYENQGNKESPHFVLRNTRISGIQMKAHATPTFWNWNDDEHQDLLVGGSEGFLSLVSHLPPAVSPALRGWTIEDTRWQSMNSIGHSTPHFIDFDGDNKTDLLMGDKEGNLLFWKNGGLAVLKDTKEESTLVLTDNTLDKTEEDLDSPSSAKTVTIHESESESEFEQEKDQPLEPIFEFVSSNYGGLVLGRRAFPAFLDIDGDNKFDLVVGNNAGELRYYRRNSASSGVQWILESKQFLDYQGGKNSAPVFADVDEDGDYDLLVGNQQGSIQYWENKGTAEIADFVYNPLPFLGVTGGRNSVPAVIDLNNDGRNDLLIGNFMGQLYQYLQTADSNGLRFKLERRKYLNLDVGLGAVPKITDLNNDKNLDLIIGSDSGKFFRLQADPENSSSTVTWKSLKDYFKELELPVGGNPIFVDLDQDGDLDLMIGSEEGTLHYFRNTGR